MASMMTSAPRVGLVSKVNNRTRAVKVSSRGSRQVVRAELETQVVISACNAACLALGRWAFLPIQRQAVENAGMPVQNGVTHAEAGDIRAQEATFITTTNDPAGFTLVDTLAWGSIGHVLGFAILATSSL